MVLWQRSPAFFRLYSHAIELTIDNHCTESKIVLQYVTSWHEQQQQYTYLIDLLFNLCPDLGYLAHQPEHCLFAPFHQCWRGSEKV